MEETITFSPTPTNDDDEISLLEYFLQLSFFTTDLHITNTWTFCNKEEIASFQANSKKKFGGSLLLCCADMNKLDPPQSFENCSLSKKIRLDYKKQLFEHGTISPPSGFQGNPTGTFRMLVFKVALGTVYSYTPDSKDFHDHFLNFEIPRGYNSLELVTNNDPKRFNSLYRVSDSSQVLLYAAVEFEFTPLKVHVPEPVCEMCESSLATWYCHSDRAHFCNTCDMKQHISTKIFSRHIRIPCSKSPNQFGLCQQHPTNVVDMVCLKCCTLLCSNCILFGKHSLPSFFDHPLMSTLDTYELSLEKNSDYDEKLKFRRNEISEKIKNRHNSTSQIYANSKGVENKIEYCKKLLLQQLDEMKSKKLNYLGSIEREVKSQLNLIKWMQSFLDHLLMALEPCQFIMFKKRYDLLVSKYFTGDLSQFLDFPVWMDKQLTLTGDVTITCSSVKNLQTSFSKTQTTDVKVKSPVSKTQNQEHQKTKLLDWTPLNMYEDLNETVGRFPVPPDTNNYEEANDSKPLSYPDVPPTKLLQSNQKKTLNHHDVLDTATKLWNFLSDFKMGTAVQLLKVFELPERSLLVRHVLNLANHFEQLGPLFTNISNYEMNSVVSDYGYCVLLRSSGVLCDILSLVFCSNLSTTDNLDFLRQLTSPVEQYFKQYLSSSSNTSTQRDAQSSTDNTNDNDEEFQELVNNCMVDVVVKLISFDIISLPTSFQYVFYCLTDLFFKLKSEYSSHIVVDFFCTVLSNYFSRYLTNNDTANLLYVSSTDTNNSSVTVKEHTDNNQKYQKLISFTRELSFKFARAAIVVWQLDSLTFDESYELKQSQKIFDWSKSMVSKPKLNAKLLLRTATLEDLDQSSNFVLSQVSKFEKRLSSGQTDIPYSHLTELTGKYNFMHLFQMASQIFT